MCTPLSLLDWVCRRSNTCLLLWPSFRMSYPSISCSELLKDLVFAGHTRNVYGHCTHRILPMKTSAASSDLGIQQDGVTTLGASRNHSVLPSSASKGCASNRMDLIGVANGTSDEVSKDMVEVERHCMPTAVPDFLITYIPKVCVCGGGCAWAAVCGYVCGSVYVCVLVCVGVLLYMCGGDSCKHALTSTCLHRSILYLFLCTVPTEQLPSFTRSGSLVVLLNSSSSFSTAWAPALLLPPLLGAPCCLACSTSPLEAWKVPIHPMDGPTSTYQVGELTSH